MQTPIFAKAIKLAPENATFIIGVLSLIVAIIIVTLAWKSRKKIKPFQPFNFKLTPTQRKENKLKEQGILTQKCIDETIALLKKAIIKKTYKAFLLPQSTIYTIPLNREEAIMYIWGNVIAATPEANKDRVVRVAALMLCLIKKNKKKHILELEAKALFAARLYGNNASSHLEYRAVANVGAYSSMTPSDFALKSISIAREECISVEFIWPDNVKNRVPLLMSLALRAISHDDLMDVTVFPCISCHTNCNIFELENLKCKKCNKNG